MLLSLDSSIANCGFAVLDKEKVIRSGVIKTNAKADMSDRIYELSENIKAILGCKDYQVTEAVMETRSAFSYTRSSRYGKGLNQKDLHKNSEAIGAIRLTLKQWGIPFQTIEATEWKGGRSKGIDKMVASNYVGKEVKNPDIADAIMLGIFYLNHKKIQEGES